MYWLFIIFGVGVLISEVLKMIKTEKKAAAKFAELLTAHPGSKVAVSADDFSYCVVDFQKKQIILGLAEPKISLRGSAALYEKAYAFDQIAKVELLKDGTTVTRTNRGSQAVGVAVGALALGGVGAVIGGLSGSSTATERVRRISLAVYVDDPNMPIHKITFFNYAQDKKGVKVESLQLAQPAKLAEEFCAHVSNAIRSVDREAAMPVAAPASLPTQIKEFWALVQAGAMTPGEFEAEKQRLLQALPLPYHLHQSQ